jgi:type I restriction enzyme, S subunit
VIDGLKPYTEYKESGLPWLGRLPAHWDLVPNRALMREQREVVGEESSRHTLLSLTLGGIVPRDMETPKGKFPAQFNTYKVVRPDDLVFCLFDIDETPRGVGHSKLNGMITGAYDIFSPRPRANARYLYLYYLFIDEGKRLKPLYTGLRKTIPRGAFASLKTPCPKSDEQDGIVRFLDHANGRIDRAIRAKKKLIALLNEQKQAVIHRAVTRGLDPTVPLKPSGIPWLGDIPKHWQSKRLKAIAEIRYGLGQPPRETENGLPLIRATNVDGGRILEKNLVRVDPADVPKTRNAFLTEGEIIVVRSGALTADSAIIPKRYAGAVAGYDMVVTVRRARPDFVAMALLCSYVQVDQLVIASMRAAQPHLNKEELGVAAILLPPEEEQKRIVRFIEERNASLDEALTRTEREIELLCEYRTRLVADVVTGKLDVRAAARHLPVAPATPEPAPETEDSAQPETEEAET